MGELDLNRSDYTAARARSKFDADRGYASRSSSHGHENAKAGEYGDMEWRKGPGEQRSAVISWKGTWTRAMVSRLCPRVTDAWEAVARQQNSLRLTVIEEALNESDAAEIKSHGDAIYHLNLSSPVIRPISLRQTRMEQMIREGAMASSHENGNFFKIFRGEDADI
ncbi:hypothetical protein SUNI508_04517 [Seiridium unicorne]|uniref:DUF6546 domain-containing protein n=1 Tax=Seiridium unicorne TaxID=138068 RepID=A0ABR2V9E4_9PEZI